MLKQGLLVLVDDDPEDQELMNHTLRDLGFGHEIKMFNCAEAALSFLYESSEQPFLIVSDVNMPKMDGISFKKKIEECSILRSKSIPFIFLSTSSKFVKDTWDLNIQGYFEKGNSLQELHDTMKIIFGYWERTKHKRNRNVADTRN
jgi:two-component SAPR family response regulator